MAILDLNKRTSKIIGGCFYTGTIPRENKRTGKIWFNNEFVDWSNAKIHILSHGFHYASCIFEGLRVYDSQIFKLEEHTERFFHSANRLGFEMPYSMNEINNHDMRSILYTISKKFILPKFKNLNDVANFAGLIGCDYSCGGHRF